MDSHRSEKLNVVFRQAKALPPEELGRFLESVCGTDPELREQVERLLAESRTVQHSLPTADSPAFEIFPGLPAGHLLAGRFRIIRFLGRGGMGEVYLAADADLGVEIAIKTLRPELLQDPHFLGRFRREVQLARQVTHPNVCRVFDVGRDVYQGVDLAFLTMEYLSGQTISEHLRVEGPLPVEQALPVARQMAAGIDALHTKGIAHRDLKPGNVMLVPAKDGALRAVINDFGLARAFEDEAFSEQLSRPGHVVGTPSYMAPEQLLGEPCTPASDIYSFGLILYELVTGQRAFTAASALEQAVAWRSDPGVPAKDLVSSLPAPWSETIRACLARNPLERPPTATEAVARIAGESRSQVRPSVLVAPPAVRPGRNVMWLVVAVVVLLGLGGAAVWKWTHPGSPGGSVADVNVDYIRAMELLNNSYRPTNVANAIAVLEPLVAAHPDFALGHAALGMAYWRQPPALRDSAAIEKARAASQRALELDPNLVRAHITLGSIYVYGGKKDLAAAELQKAVRLDARNPEVYTALADLYQQQGRDADIEPALQKAVDLAPDSWRAHDFLAVHFERTGQFDKAIDHVKKVLELAPDNPRALTRLGVIHLKANRFGEAIIAFRQSLDIEPSASTYTNLGSALLLEGKYKAAVEPLRKAVDMVPSNGQYWGNLASAYVWAGNSKEAAAEAYRKAAALSEQERTRNPNNTQTLSLLAGYYAYLGEPEKSKPLLRQALALSPETPNVLIRAAETYELLHERDEALRYVKKAVDLGYPMPLIERSPELAGLRKDPRFSLVPRKDLR